jgi:murein DD-endopeptidase MepM/ murein hydrolase activator NlpD
MSIRRWMVLACLLGLIGLSLRYCVVIVPADRQELSSQATPQDRDQENAPALRVPVEGVRGADLVDTYSQSREAGQRVHNAIDIPAPRGTPVLAAAPGVVEKLFQSARGGNTVYIRSPDRLWLYYYAHLDSYAPGLREGMKIEAGSRIGAVGSTGNASADSPHLHFAINRMALAQRWFEGEPVNPYPMLVQSRKN